jgi:hypothetical protein
MSNIFFSQKFGIFSQGAGSRKGIQVQNFLENAGPVKGLLINELYTDGH